MLSNLIISSTVLSKLTFINLSNNNKIKKNSKTNAYKSSNNLNLLVGKDSNNEYIYIPEKGLYQNILITGTIGTGKTSSAMYPFTRQLIEFNYKNPKNKLGMLILDVKGNYISKVLEFAKSCNRLNDVISIEVNRKEYI